MSIKTWGSSIKVEARNHTLIRPCKWFFGDKIPAGYQYWTNCGNLMLEGGKEKNPDNEYEQIASSGIITPDQFCGIEYDEKIMNDNKKAYPELNLYHGNYISVISKAAEEGRFRPGFINLDLYYMPERAALLFCKVVELVMKCDIPKVMIVINTTLRNNSSGQWVKNDLFPTIVFANNTWNQYADYWSGDPNCYHYVGSTTKLNDMCTYVVWKD